MSDRLKKLRKEKGLTQADLAKVLNTNQSQYGKYENGKTNLSIENAKILANFLGVTLSYLLGLDDYSCIDGSKNMTPFQSLVRDRGLSLKLSKFDPFEKTPNRIGELINSSDKSLKQISQEININYGTLSAYKRQLRCPKKENAKILAEYFGVSIPYLLGYEENFTANKPNATISIELVKELSLISEKKSKLLQEYIELDKKERDILEQISSVVL